MHLIQHYIAPTAVLFLLPTTHTTIIIKNNTTLSQNNISTIFGGTDDSAASIFDASQQTTVGLSELPIRTLVPDPISTESYRKAVKSKLFLNQILYLAEYLSVALNDLLYTVNS